VSDLVVCYVISLSPQQQEVDAFFPFFTYEEVNIQMIEFIAWSYVAGKWYNWDPNLVQLDFSDTDDSDCLLTY
jgi:hypothetical protein